jgi:phosphoglycerol transferase MdoB-like AlkP superfamily enzyme
MKRHHGPTSTFILLLALTLSFGLTSRILFLVISGASLGFIDLMKGLLLGTVFDASVALYSYIPFSILGFLPSSWLEKARVQKIYFVVFYIVSATVAFASLAEAFFVDEFHARFNFIAVDYLVYTNEVLRNLWESYPIVWILPVFFLTHFLLSRLLFPAFKRRGTAAFPAAQNIGLLALVILGFSFISESRFLNGLDSVQADFSKNPVYALFAAYNNNEIDYHRFYASFDENRASHLVHEALERDIPGFEESEDDEKEDETSIVRNIHREGSERRLNVVLVLMESMSARYMGLFGSRSHLTPNLDRLAHQGLYFDQVYSTGTRTVRGIEAVTLSIPPTPGQSIVRRPDSQGMFNIGSLFNERGYVNQFIYGGRAFFDNMGNFFSSNGFQVLDQAAMNPKDIGFSNAWGVCDEDLFRYALKSADRISAKPFFQFVLTTSNHRPYTYPDGRIDIPSHSGRDGAVKYADYAIGKYIEAARSKPWFKDTVFIFVADHNGSVAGGTKIDPRDYLIPLIFYSPGHVSPRKISLMGSQIDVAPTLAGLLNFSYQSRFFGHDLLSAKTERAFLATYEDVGLLKPDKMTILAPNRKVELFRIQRRGADLVPQVISQDDAPSKDADLEETIGFYEAASDWYGEKLLKEGRKSSLKKNSRIF